MKINSIYKQYLILSALISLLVLSSIAAVIITDYKLLADAKMFHYSQEAKSLTHDIEADFNFIEEFSKIIGRKISEHGTNDPIIIADIFTKNLPIARINKDVLYLTLFDFVAPDGKVVASTLEGVIHNPRIVKKEQRSWMELGPKEPWEVHLSKPDYGIVTPGQPHNYIIPAGMGITDQNNKFLGIISTGISVDRLYSKANQARFSLNSSFVLLSEDLQLISARQEDQDFFQDKITSAITKDQAGLLPKPIEYKGSKYYCYRKVKNWPFLILVGENSISLQNEFNNKVIPHVIQITIIAFLMLLFFYLVRRQIISPIVDLAKITKAISLGADNVAIPMYNSNEMNLLAEELIKLQNYTSELRVTKEKLESAQETLASSNQILERNVIERTASLEQDLAAKTQFLNNISHEVRTPIQGITSISEGLVENWYSFDEEKDFIII